MSRRILLGISFFLPGAAWAALDKNSNGISDVWESMFQTSGLNAGADTDGDGFSNSTEAAAGTDPRNLFSRPELNPTPGLPGHMFLQWPSVAGKSYQILTSSTPAGPWQPLGATAGTGAMLSYDDDIAAISRRFYKMSVGDVDSDLDGLTDSEELAIGFNPSSAHTDRYDTPDFQRVDTAWNAASTISVGLLDGDFSERWPDNGVIAIRRTGGMQPLTINFAISGTTARGTDYTMLAGNSIQLPVGSREVWVQFQPVADADDGESDETIILTLAAGTGYTLGAAQSATVTLHNETAGGLPSAKAASRFLVQAVFGPDQDSSGDADLIPENVEQVVQLGYTAWLDQQFAVNPPGYLEPFVQYSNQISQYYTDPKEGSWWNRVMGASLLYYPGGPAQPYDPLRQRMAFSLSQLMVVSDRPETLAVEFRGMANYYDLFVKHAFGNFRDLLFDVTMHPVMGFYLSALLNKKADLAANIFPDENYAREIMQLFSIGLWELNQDGTRKLDANNNPIPTYTNFHITQFARVFTGLSHGSANSFTFSYANNAWLIPMKLWDAHHDLAPKTLLNGLVTPQRVASNPDTGAAALADINLAIDNLFNHPNVGPFFGRFLIQRFVTSNPSPAYIGRVAAKFADNGSGVRGDLKAVLRQVLLDPEARDPAKLSDPHWGKLREPLLKFANFARAFNAATQDGFYSLDQFFLDHQEEPMKAPSVFNFYLPNYSPPGPLVQAGLVAPEFQIINASTAIAAPNHYYSALTSRDLHRWGTGMSSRAARPSLTQEEQLAQTDVDALLRKLDLALTCGNMQPRELQIIRDSVLRFETWMYQYEKERVNLAIYLFLTSPECSVLR